MVWNSCSFRGAAYRRGDVWCGTTGWCVARWGLVWRSKARHGKSILAYLSLFLTMKLYDGTERGIIRPPGRPIEAGTCRKSRISKRFFPGVGHTSDTPQNEKTPPPDHNHILVIYSRPHIGRRPLSSDVSPYLYNSIGSTDGPVCQRRQ